MMCVKIPHRFEKKTLEQRTCAMNNEIELLGLIN